MTDILITINEEDYKFAKCYLHAKKVRYIPGTGIDLNKFKRIELDKADFNRKLGIPEKSKIILSVGELNKNKNHAVVIKAISDLKDTHLYYIICGQGKLKGYLENMAGKLGISEQIRLVDFKNDVNEICAVADLFVFPSYREGLPVALMEAMACGLPCIASDIRGNRDLIYNGKNGFLVAPGSSKEFVGAITETLCNTSIQKSMAEESKRILTAFCLDKVKEQMEQIYLLLD